MNNEPDFSLQIAGSRERESERQFLRSRIAIRKPILHLRPFREDRRIRYRTCRNLIRIRERFQLWRVSTLLDDFETRFWLGLRSVEGCALSRDKKLARVNFTQHFTRALFVRKRIMQLSLVTFQLCNFLAPKFCTKNVCVKRWWNWQQMSISSTFYACLFWMN